MPELLEPDWHGAPEAEFAGRLARVQVVMAERGVAALVLTAADNFIYLTGFDSPTWVNLARPRFCIVPARGELTLVVPTTNVSAAERMTWVRDIRSWVSPNPADDGLTLVKEAVAAVAAPDAVVGMEIGPQSRLGLPVTDFLTLREQLAPRRIVDADGVLRKVRKVKTPAEITLIRRAAEATSRAFAQLPPRLRSGRGEIESVADLRALLFAEGVDDAPYIVAESGKGGYPSLQMAPSERRLMPGSVLGIDAGCRVGGYFCDFNRNFAFGPVADITRRIDDVLWEAVAAGIAVARPGATAGDVWRAMAKSSASALEAIGGRLPLSGRMGHGIGLRLTEPPSIHPDDTTLLTPGMVLAVEPSAEFPVETGRGTVSRLLIHEENIVVTGDGAALLSTRAGRGLVTIA
jgi:Xaa-Pro aminopeptidase